jgi:hypothetical protein
MVALRRPGVWRTAADGKMRSLCPAALPELMGSDIANL